MEDIRTYHVGSGEITLTAQDAEELRRILQFEYIEHCINEVIDADPKYFVFTSEHNRPAFIRKVADRYDDLVDIEVGALYEPVLHDTKQARHRKVEQELDVLRQ